MEYSMFFFDIIREVYVIDFIEIYFYCINLYLGFGINLEIWCFFLYKYIIQYDY